MSALTKDELARLDAAGIRYPWDPRQSLRLLDQIDKLTPKVTMACDRCQGPLGVRWWQKVPGAGNLCDPCHEVWLTERADAERERLRGEKDAVCPVCGEIHEGDCR